MDLSSFFPPKSQMVRSFLLSENLQTFGLKNVVLPFNPMVGVIFSFGKGFNSVNFSLIFSKSDWKVLICFFYSFS
jgi:hypothetical protein